MKAYIKTVLEIGLITETQVMEDSFHWGFKKVPKNYLAVCFQFGRRESKLSVMHGLIIFQVRNLLTIWLKPFNSLIKNWDVITIQIFLVILEIL